jgi:hypothetical protein
MRTGSDSGSGNSSNLSNDVDGKVDKVVEAEIWSLDLPT